MLLLFPVDAGSHAEAAAPLALFFHCIASFLFSSQAPPDTSPNNAFSRIQFGDIEGSDLVLAAKEWGVPAQRYAISLDTNGRFVAFSEGM
jgi:hypothetical protein